MREQRFTGLRAAIFGSLFLAILSTLGDWVWAQWIPAGRMIHGVVHGAVIFAAIGLVLGLATRAREGTRGALVGRAVTAELALGVAISASFYPLYRWVGLASLFITWMALWLGTARVERWLGAGVRSSGQALARGSIAAVLSGLAFWTVSGIWTQPAPDGPNLVWHLLCWFIAFVPGFAALLVDRRASATP